MPIYRVDRIFDARNMLISEVRGRDGEMENYLRKRLRHPGKTTWEMGGTSGFLYSARKITQNLIKSGYDGYTFHLLDGEEAERAGMILGIFD